VAFDYADTHPGTLVIVVADHETGGFTIPSTAGFKAANADIAYAWSTGNHSASMTPLFAYGAGAENFGGILDNTGVNRRMERLLELETVE
jgi:alkaline phosphatase